MEGFAYGRQLEQQSMGKGQARRNKTGSKSQQDLRIRDVWASNLTEEMDLLEQLVEKYPYISMVGAMFEFESSAAYDALGHRVPRHCRSTDGRFYNES